MILLNVEWWGGSLYCPWDHGRSRLNNEMLVWSWSHVSASQIVFDPIQSLQEWHGVIQDLEGMQTHDLPINTICINGTHYIPFVDQHDMNHYSKAKHNPGTMQTIFTSQTITTNDITAKPITTQQNTFTANHMNIDMAYLHYGCDNKCTCTNYYSGSQIT